MKTFANTPAMDKAVICASINLEISLNDATELIEEAKINGSHTCIVNDKVIVITHEVDTEDSTNELFSIIIRDQFEERFCLNTRFVGRLFTHTLNGELQDFFNSDATLTYELLDFFTEYAQNHRNGTTVPDLNNRFLHIFGLFDMDRWMSTKRYNILDRTPIECVIA